MLYYRKKLSLILEAEEHTLHLEEGKKLMWMWKLKQ